MLAGAFINITRVLVLFISGRVGHQLQPTHPALEVETPKSKPGLCQTWRLTRPLHPSYRIPFGLLAEALEDLLGPLHDGLHDLFEESNKS